MQLRHVAQFKYKVKKKREKQLYYVTQFKKVRKNNYTTWHNSKNIIKKKPKKQSRHVVQFYLFLDMSSKFFLRCVLHSAKLQMIFKLKREILNYFDFPRFPIDFHWNFLGIWAFSMKFHMDFDFPRFPIDFLWNFLGISMKFDFHF